MTAPPLTPAAQARDLAAAIRTMLDDVAATGRLASNREWGRGMEDAAIRLRRRFDEAVADRLDAWADAQEPRAVPS